jgi:hypothetical protein
VRERTRDGIDNDTAQLATDAVAAYDFAADRELRGFAHKVASRPIAFFAGLNRWAHAARVALDLLGAPFQTWPGNDAE